MQTEAPGLPQLVSLAELARMWGVTEATARRWARDAQLPAVKIGRDWRFDASALRRIIESSVRRGA
jgi:excisionase family DNA binding protein